MRRRLLLLGGVALCVWVVLAALWVIRLALDLQEGNDAARAAREQLGADEIAEQEPLPDLRVAAKRLTAARDRAGGIVLAPLRLAPVIGRQLRSIEALSGAAAEVAEAGVDAVERAAIVFDDPAGAGRDRVEQVRELRDIVRDVAADLETVDDLGPVEGLLGPLADARNDLAADLVEAHSALQDARAGADAALSLITGPRRYLVLAANNAEMRAGSGMWLQGGTLVTGDGDLELEEMVSVGLAQPPAGAVVPEGDFAARWGFLLPGDEWRNLMASPRFAESAALAVDMWRAAGRGEVDGVIAVDAIGLQAIVKATGPVTVGDRTLDADGVPEHVLHDQYLQLDDDEGFDEQNAGRRDQLALLARSAVDAIDAGDYPASTLIRTLGEAVAGRHLLAWSTDDVEQRGWVAAGMDGDLGPRSMLVSILNRGANKLDWFLDVDAELSVERNDGGWDVTVELEVVNGAPAGEPKYVQGPYGNIGLDAGEYRGILAVNVPGAASGARFEGIDRLTVAGADGPTRVVGFQFDLARGARREFVLRFHLSAAMRELVVEPSARVPETTWHYGSSDWKDSQSTTAKW